MAKMAGQRTIYVRKSLHSVSTRELTSLTAGYHPPLRGPLFRGWPTVSCWNYSPEYRINLWARRLHVTAIGILAHVVYLQNFSRTWPAISLTSLPFLASCVLVVISHFVSFSHFSERARDPRHAYGGGYGAKKMGSAGRGGRQMAPEDTFLDVATFFGLCVWLVPFYLFLSLSANDNVLPSAGMSLRLSPSSPANDLLSADSTSSSSSSQLPHDLTNSRTHSLLRTALSSAFSHLPSTLRGSPRSSAQREGLIAAPTSLPSSPAFEKPRYGFGDGARTPPPMSPGSGGPTWNGVPSPLGNDARRASFKLSMPPRRNTEGNIAAHGHRRVASASVPGHVYGGEVERRVEELERKVSPPPLAGSSPVGLVKRKAV